MDTRHTDPGLTPTRQQAASGPTVTLDGRPVTELWAALVDTDAVREAFVRSVRSFARGRTVPELYDDLDERGVPYWLRSPVRSVAQGDRAAAWELVGRRLPAVGRDAGTVDNLLAVAGLVAAGEGDAATPTVTVVVGADFREQRREQRVDICRLLATLARGVDVRLVCSGLTQRWLIEAHREELPVSSFDNHPRDSGPVSALVEPALATLDPEGTAVEVLRRVAHAPGETLSYASLYGSPGLPSRSAIRQHLGTLTDLSLVERFGPDAHRKVELLPAGRAYLERLAEENDARPADSPGVSNPPNDCIQAVCSQQGREGGEEREPYTTAYLSRAAHTAAAAVGSSGSVTVVNSQFPSADGSPDRTRYVSVDEDRQEAVIAVRASDALPHVVSTAIALASPRLLTPILTDQRLEELDEPPAILRDARCIGGLSDEALSDADALREAFVEWGEELAGLTTKLRREEYESRDRFRGEIMRVAHGLAGSVAHLVDALGFDLTREIRVPDRLNDRQHTALARSVAVAASVQSRYGAFATYRQLFEDRSDKRERSFSPTVDAADPMGALIGSFVIRGPDVHRFRPSLEAALREPAELHEDAPEFVVPVPVESVGRSATASVVSRLCPPKGLRPTREAVSVLDALAESPYAVARGVQQLGEETRRRDLRPRDVRYALSVLSPAVLLPDLPPTVGAVVSTLLRADGALTQRELARRADVSPESVRSHRETLAALGLLEVSVGDTVEYRLAIGGEHGDSSAAYPGCVVGNSGFVDAVNDLAAAVLPASAYGDPSGPVYEALAWPPDPWAVGDVPVLRPWVEFVAQLANTVRDQDAVTVEMGPELEQRSLEEAVATPTHGFGVSRCR